MKTIKQVLFVVGGLCEDVCLFESQADLARAAAATKNGKDATNVRAFINQVLNGKRPLSKNLREMIIGAATKRFPPRTDKARAITILNEVFDSFEKPVDHEITIEVTLEDIDFIRTIAEQMEQPLTLGLVNELISRRKKKKP